MIVDHYHGEFALFDGANYLPMQREEMANNIFGRNVTNDRQVINTFVCIIHFSSSHTFTIPGKKDMIRKECSSLISQFPKILTKTTKLTQKKDMYAIVKIEKFENNILFCEVCSNGYLGEVGDPIIEERLMEFVCTAHWKNSKKMTSQFIELKNTDLTPVRTDLTEFEIYSIDPPGCLDIDDALHYRFDSINGEHEIGIHIADVSSFIVEGSTLDNELKSRVETVYNYKKKPIHMIPEELSVEHISLREGSPKRAFSVILRLNSNFEIINVEFKKTQINVTKNLTYDEAQEMIANNSNENIEQLYKIGIKLKKQISRAFQNEIGEIYDTHQMVAVYMIFANKLAGEKIQLINPESVLLRVHTGQNDQQKPEELEIFNEIEHNLSSINPILIQKNMVSHMEQARYQIGVENCRHHGLDLGFYTHMTSPIRRYADIIIHRQLWKIISGEQITHPEIETIFSMNFYKKLFKQMERYMHVSEIASILGTTCQETDAYITSINEDRESIRIFVPKFDLDYDLRLVHNKMKSIIKVIISDRKITIKNIHEETEISYELFQQIRIKFVATREPFVKLRFEIIV
jgi:exoribonuclease R